MYENKDEQLNRSIREKLAQARHRPPTDMWDKIESRRKNSANHKAAFITKSLLFMLLFLTSPFLTTDHRWEESEVRDLVASNDAVKFDLHNLSTELKNDEQPIVSDKQNKTKQANPMATKTLFSVSKLSAIEEDINHEIRKRPTLDLSRPLEEASHSAKHRETVHHETAEAGSSLQAESTRSARAAKGQEDASFQSIRSNLNTQPQYLSSGSSHETQIHETNDNQNATSTAQNKWLAGINAQSDFSLFSICNPQISPNNFFLSAVDSKKLEILTVRKNHFQMVDRRKWFFEFSYLLVHHEMNMQLSENATDFTQSVMEIRSSGSRTFTGEQINLRLGYAFNDHFSVKGGVSFTSFRQEVNQNVEDLKVGEDERMNVDSTYKGLIIHSREDYEPVYEYDTQRYTVPILTNDEVSSYTTFDFVHIPLMLDYKWYLNKRFSLYGQAGLVLSRLTKAETTKFNSAVFDFSYFNAATRYDNSYQLGYVAGGGVNFHIHHYLSTFVEFNYMTMSNQITYNHEPIQERPSQLGIGIGFRWLLY